MQKMHPPSHPTFIVGTRPESIKLLPVIREFSNLGIISSVVLTGQHNESLVCRDLFLKENAKISCAENFSIEGIKKKISSFHSEIVFVQGDTKSAFYGAVAAHQLKIPLIHVEAGLRTFSFQPWPEEWLRVQISKLADLHFAPSKLAKRNLLNEGVESERIIFSGNTIIDAVKISMRQSNNFYNLRKERKFKRIVLVTSHRRENGPNRSAVIYHSMLQAVRTLGFQFIIVEHHNSYLAKIAKKNSAEGVEVIPPLAHAEFVSLMYQSDIILTDSGGVQEEASCLGKPLIILREKTERPEAVSTGCALLVGADPHLIFRALQHFMLDNKVDPNTYQYHFVYGHGDAAKKIADETIRFMNV
ncbi:MAG: UDP-N-acetylglucosamine 2-epimerase (non-hydrolyzing) [Pseudomonadota bacterium]